MGATTIWERWDGEKPDRSFENPGMNSFNHYAYGAIGDFMYRVVTGIDTYEDEPGYKHISIHPHIGGGLTYANADLQTYYGKISSHWKTENDKTYFDVEIPANTSADVVLPAADVSNVTESGNVLSSVKDIKIVGKQNGNVTIHIGSGSYHFVCSK
jgi:alpha-L-rhamnosidase